MIQRPAERVLEGALRDFEWGGPRLTVRRDSLYCLGVLDRRADGNLRLFRMLLTHCGQLWLQIVFGRPLFALVSSTWRIAVWLPLAVTTIASIVVGPRIFPDSFCAASFSTTVGTQRTVTLHDGSLVTLNTQSRIEWMGGTRRGHIEVVEGEALFNVSHDPGSPFRVRVGSSEIVALGTEFDVYRKRDGSVIVTVLSGKVAITGLVESSAPAPALILKAGEQIRYTSGGSVLESMRAVDVDTAVSWRDGRLWMEGLSIQQMVEELGRYSTKSIVIADPRLAAAHFRIGGSFSFHDIPGTLQSLTRVFPITVTDTADAYVLTLQ